MFLLTIEDEDLFIMLEDLEWSYLKEIFDEVKCWSESLKPTRATWLEVSGIPLHCWNGTTLKRVAELWGTFEAFGENLQHNLDCEKVTILISTNQFKHIDEVVELEVGSLKYEIKVVEHGFKDSTSDPLSVKKNPHPHEINAGAKLGSQSEESSETTFPGESPNSYFVEDEAVEAVFVGKDFHNNRDHAGVDVSRQIGESVMSGSAFQEVTLKAVEPQAVNDKKAGQETPVIEDRRTWSDIVCGGASTIAEAANGKTVDNPITGPDATPFRVLEDVKNMGLMVEGESAVVKQKDNKVNWAKEIEDRFAASANKWFGLQEGVDCVVTQSEGEENGGFFPELENSNLKRKNKKGKKYRSLLEFQEKALTTAEKKRRDRALRRKKIKKQDLENSELSGRSLSDFDLATRGETLIKEAKKTLKLGKKLGMQIVGCEQEVVRELMLLEAN
ncbi:hypothetical protein GQ457_04G009880 [Hibiscus cannabinus]